MTSFRTLASMLLAACVTVAAPCAFADTVTYANITNSTGTVVTGTLNGDAFTITGPTAFVNLSGSNNINYFVPNAGNPTSPVYIGGNISNAPTDKGIVALQSPNQSYTITFANPLSGTLVFSEVSLGDGPIVSYTFDHSFTVETCGEGYWGGGCFQQGVGTSGTVLSGGESSGSIEFNGPVSSLSFTVGGNSEYWNGFDLGVVDAASPVPEPS